MGLSVRRIGTLAGGLAVLLPLLGAGCTPAATLQRASAGSQPAAGSTGGSSSGTASYGATGSGSTEGTGHGSATDTTAVLPSSSGVALPTDPGQPASPEGRRYPLVPSDPAQLARLLVSVEAALRSRPPRRRSCRPWAISSR